MIRDYTCKSCKDIPESDFLIRWVQHSDPMDLLTVADGYEVEHGEVVWSHLRIESSGGSNSLCVRYRWGSSERPTLGQVVARVDAIRAFRSQFR